jgi:DNA mismatch endonuclease (patch repair protein)
MPKSKLEFWRPKLENNRKRDLAAQRKLRSLGWKCLVVWECELRDADALTERLKGFLEEAK